MKKSIKYLVYTFLSVLGVFYSCQDMEDIHSEYIKDGEIKYTNKADSLETFAGNKRILISGYISGAFNVNEIVVTWDKGSQMKKFPYSKSENHTDELELYITDLEEKSYEFEVYSKDEDGNQSVPVTVFGTAYGENYISNLEARSVNSTSFDGTNAEVQLAISGDEFQRDTEVKYTNKDDEEVVLTIGVDESDLVLTNANSEIPVMYRTFYVPTLADEDGNETSIDVFPSAWKSFELILENPIFFDKSDWVITDFSSEEPAEGAPNGLATAAIDGDLNTFWHSQWTGTPPGYPHHITIDMGIEKTIRGFETFRRQNDGRGQTKHKLHVSLDGSNWTDLGEFNVDPNVNAGQVFLFSPVQARYVKYEATEGSNFFAFLAEINILEVIDNSGWLITDFSSEMGDGPASNTIDGQLSTFWHSEWTPTQPPYPHYFTFDMGVEKTITNFETFRRQGDGRGQTKHKIHVSTDGTNWTDLGEHNVDPNADAGQIFDVAPTKARYVKYEATEGSNFFAFLAEINVIGY